jgi:hypothetical protein
MTGRQVGLSQERINLVGDGDEPLWPMRAPQVAIGSRLVTESHQLAANQRKSQDALAIQ